MSAARAGAAAAPARPGAPEGAQRGPLAPSAMTTVQRRRLLAAAAAALVVLVAVLVWPIGLLTGDDNNSGSDASASSSPIYTKRQGSAIIAESEGQDADPRPGRGAHAEHADHGLPGLALRLGLEAQVARRHGDGHEGQPARDRQPAR